ncbi:MAG: class B sortase [Oscillospiraceae bacterium]|nr:class B sortase [Oscillospiraceae bacterium]
MKNLKKRIYCVLLLLLAGIVIFAAYQIRAEKILIQDSDAQMALKPSLISPPPEATHESTPDGIPDDSPEAEAENSSETATEDTTPALPMMDFSEVQAKNPDIVAWLVIDGLGIDYPIVQGTDNSYYLNHTAENKYNKLGALFEDFRNNPDFSDFNSIIYGHNRKSPQVFGRLSLMKDQETFDKITTGYLYTPAKTYRIDIFAIVVGGSRSEFYNYIFASAQAKQWHLDMIRQYAMHYRDIDITAEDRILSLSTCSYEYKDARTILIAKLSD